MNFAYYLQYVLKKRSLKSCFGGCTDCCLTRMSILAVFKEHLVSSFQKKLYFYGGSLYARGKEALRRIDYHVLPTKVEMSQNYFHYTIVSIDASDNSERRCTWIKEHQVNIIFVIWNVDIRFIPIQWNERPFVNE